MEERTKVKGIFRFFLSFSFYYYCMCVFICTKEEEEEEERERRVLNYTYFNYTQRSSVFVCRHTYKVFVRSYRSHFCFFVGLSSRSWQ